MCDSEHQSDVMYGNYSVSERDWEQRVGFNILGASLIHRFVTLASEVEFSPGIHDGMVRIEFVESHSLELMKKADELPLIKSNIVSMHDLLSCHLHTLTPSHSSSHTNIFTYTPYHTTLIFTHPHSHPCTVLTHHTLPPSHTLVTPSLPSHTLISHPHPHSLRCM